MPTHINFGFILSGPAVLFGFMLVSSFRTPFSVISSSSAEGYWPDILQRVLNSSGLYVSLVEKADWNCLFRMFAWSTG